MSSGKLAPLIAIACGGTGGHLFPGLAVAHELRRRHCRVTLLVSRKEIDQTAVQGLSDIEVQALPAVGFSQGHLVGFLRGFFRSYSLAKACFRPDKPAAVLGMGGFTSAPPVLAGKSLGAIPFLHESNTIPGRANRWLSWVVGEAFTGFPAAGRRLHTKNVRVTGTPVRPQFKPRDPGSSRWALGLDPDRPVALVMGGSQGASAINQLVLAALPLAARTEPPPQFVHLCGSADVEAVTNAYASLGIRAVVHSFFRDMDVALGAATIAVSRAGASSLAELAAMRLPAILIPYPAATDNHQLHNALAFDESGAAVLLRQSDAKPKELWDLLSDLMANPARRAAMQRALDTWHRPAAAEQIAQAILQRFPARTVVEDRTLSTQDARWAARDAEDNPAEPGNHHRALAPTEVTA